MKKIIMITMLILLACGSLFAWTSDWYAHYLLGYVEASITFSLDIIQEVLPFDLDSVEVKENTSTTDVVGLRIGSYSLVSNNSNFSLFVTHSPLTLSVPASESNTGTVTSIDYRLYMFTGVNREFKSTLSASNPASPASAESRIEIKGNEVWSSAVGPILSIVNQSLYLSLEDHTDGDTTAQRVEKLKAGTYESDIYFILIGQ